MGAGLDGRDPLEVSNGLGRARLRRSIVTAIAAHAMVADAGDASVRPQAVGRDRHERRHDPLPGDGRQKSLNGIDTDSRYVPSTADVARACGVPPAARHVWMKDRAGSTPCRRHRQSADRHDGRHSSLVSAFLLAPAPAHHGLPRAENEGSPPARGGFATNSSRASARRRLHVKYVRSAPAPSRSVPCRRNRQHRHRAVIGHGLRQTRKHRCHP